MKDGTERNWPDAQDYVGTCRQCGQRFQGEKGRIQGRKCFACAVPTASNEQISGAASSGDVVVPPAGTSKEPEPAANLWWCNSHQRRATHRGAQGYECDPRLGGITIPCQCVDLTGIAELIEGIDWPTHGGYWMAWVEHSWFPLHAMPLRDDCPTAAEIEYHARIQACQVREILAIVVQFPREDGNWPYTFQKCHPCDLFRECTRAELERALKFYGHD